MATSTEDILKKRNQKKGFITGGHLVARALKNEGVDTIFTLCGGHIIDIYDGCIEEGIKIIDFRHEQTAAHAADGYARQTGKLGCLITTAGPGFTNAITGIATAFRSESPVLHIGGQSALSQWKMGGLQELPHVEILKPITKFASTVMSTERVAEMVAMAARECFKGACGPSYLEIPRDVLDKEIPIENAKIPEKSMYRASTHTQADPKDIENLVEILSKSERPAVLFGQQVWQSRSHIEANRFVKDLMIPAYTNGASRGMIDSNSPYSFDRTRGDAFKDADLLMIVGTPFDFRMGYGGRISKDIKLIQIDQDYSNIGKNRDIDIGLTGHPGTIMLQIINKMKDVYSKEIKDKRSLWIKSLNVKEDEKYKKLLPIFTNDSTPIHPYRVAYELNEFLNDDTIFIGDGGDVVTISAQAVRPRNPGQWMDPGALGSLGVGTGFALSAKLANPNKEVLCYYGDGSFGMTAFDMETADRFGLPFIAVIGNNSAMNQIRYGQLAKYGQQKGDIANKLGDMEFSKFTSLWGGLGLDVKDPNKIQSALVEARKFVKENRKSAIVNIWVDPNEYAPGTKAQTMYK
ncbi:MAG: thiamine pyrophosphate-binding protein [Alphaproteobacteria bacterium]|uniref:Thiamine pyrophosphate-binding protein n=1 Tax=PS1 clade bacterium TaxID=2175152 RepID=A0A368DR99_9PROT|nr:acetolactate synthase [Rhodobiaceae bacterium]OUT73562.1 MAG: acetolactate synthase [Rhizobiales bacterium TMED25]RCL74174.1 MAG: thiamine pyrophosphate-binding protein [PS1 clade bacterium]|tara:strand:- start:749 stop:2476 length:1728 start_codon:yes stop_codon:yes gene_type:complete